jgi:hypothetical protein
MSPRYDVDPTSVTAVIAILEKGEYELSVGEPKSFEKVDNSQTPAKVSRGVRYPLTVAEGPETGARTFYTCYTHTDGAISFMKQFLLAVLGYPATRDDEKRFDAKYKGNDWGMDTESGGVGDVWRELNGKRVVAVVDVQLGQDGLTQQQKWVKFRPVS